MLGPAPTIGLDFAGCVLEYGEPKSMNGDATKEQDTFHTYLPKNGSFSFDVEK